MQTSIHRVAKAFSFRIFTVALLAFIPGCAVAQSTYDDDAILLHGFTHLEPADESITPNAWVVIEGERIVDVGSGMPPQASFAATYDLSGLIGLPGFIDVHGHMVAGPHALEMTEAGPTITIESVPEITEFNARMALAFGVTSVRNTGGDPEAAHDYDRRLASGEWIGPEVQHAGSVIQPGPFGGNAFAYPTTEEEWQAEAARQAALGVTYFKLYHGLSEEEVATGIRVAHEHGLLAIGDLDKVSWTRAAQLGIDGVLHALPTSPDLLEPEAREFYESYTGQDSTFMYRWFELVDYDSPLFQEMLETLVQEQVTVDLTLVVNGLTYYRDAPDRFFPAEDRHYFHPDALAGMLQFLSLSGFGWRQDDYDRAGVAMVKVYELAHRLNDAGVRLGLGTDGAGGGPLYASEMALHIEAGFTPWEVLQLGTVRNAEVMGLDSSVGRVVPGFEADLVFLRASPLDDIRNVREVEWVVNNGTVYRAEDVLPEAARMANNND